MKKLKVKITLLSIALIILSAILIGINSTNPIKLNAKAGMDKAGMDGKAGINKSGNNTYTNKDLQEDLKLNIEELRNKYSINWWESKFGSIEITNQGACDNQSYGFAEQNGIDCNPQKRLNELTTNQIKSILVHFNELSYNADRIPEVIMEDIYKNEQNSQYYHLKDFIFYKEVLPNINRLSCEMVKYTPENLPYYREMILKRLLNSYSVFKCIPNYLKDDEEIIYNTILNKKDSWRSEYIKESSNRIQQIYAKEGLEGLKKRIELNKTKK